VLKQLSAFEMLRRKRDFKDTDHAQEKESMELREWMQQVESSGNKAKKTL